MTRMSIAAVCDNCGKQFDVNESLAGKKARCSDCGHLFRIPEQGEQRKQGTRQGDPLAMSKSGSTVVNARGMGRVNRMGNPGDTAALEAISYGKPRNEGTLELIDYWVPRALSWLSFGGAAVGGILTAHTYFGKKLWVGYALMGLVALMYWQVALPMVVSAVRRAERAFHFELPKLTRRRLAITFGVPTAFAYFFVGYGDPFLTPAVAGMFFGLFAAFFIMWAVLHLNFQNAAVAFACATIGYLIAVAITVSIIFGIIKGLTTVMGPLT